MLPLLLNLALLAGPVGLPYPWLATPSPAEHSLDARFPAPAGFVRVPVAAGSWGEWLRHLPLQSAGTPVLAHDGSPIAAPAVAVVSLDVGTRDLQQCADSIIRLRAEYLYAHQRADDIAFHFTNGDLARFSRWAKGWRPRLVGTSKVVWNKKAAPDASHGSLRAYLDAVYQWAGTASLAKQTPRAPRGDVRAGDFVVIGGFPGHAVVVLDVAAADDGRRKVLLGQGFMPAQSFHVIRAPDGGAWFPLPGDGSLLTPSWPVAFPPDAWRRFPK